MSIQALALPTEEESISQELESTGSTVSATISVHVDGQTLELRLENPLSSPGVTVTGTNVILEPTSSTQTPVTYNLTFLAGTGIKSFAAPAAEVWVDDNETIGIAVNPATTTLFAMSFVNNLSPTEKAQAYSFDILYIPTGQEAKVRLKDPTILLDPPNN